MVLDSYDWRYNIGKVILSLDISHCSIGIATFDDIALAWCQRNLQCRDWTEHLTDTKPQGTNHCPLKASCGGIPYLMTALRKAFLCLVLKPSTSICPFTLAKRGGSGRSLFRSRSRRLWRALSLLPSSKSSSSEPLSKMERDQRASYDKCQRDICWCDRRTLKISF